MTERPEQKRKEMYVPCCSVVKWMEMTHVTYACKHRHIMRDVSGNHRGERVVVLKLVTDSETSVFLLGLLCIDKLRFTKTTKSR